MEKQRNLLACLLNFHWYTVFFLPKVYTLLANRLLLICIDPGGGKSKSRFYIF